MWDFNFYIKKLFLYIIFFQSITEDKKKPDSSDSFLIIS